MTLGTHMSQTTLMKLLMMPAKHHTRVEHRAMARQPLMLHPRPAMRKSGAALPLDAFLPVRRL